MSFNHLSRILIFQATYWTDDNAVFGSYVCTVTNSRQYHQKGWLCHFRCVNARGEIPERIRPMLDQRHASKLDLDQSVPTIAQGNDGIALKSACVMIVADVAEMRIRINAQIAHGKRLKQEAKGLQISHQTFRTYSQC